MFVNFDLCYECIVQIVVFFDVNWFQGVMVDFEEVFDNVQGDFKQFLGELVDVFVLYGWGIVLLVFFDDEVWDYVVYVKIVDFELLMVYDQYWVGKDVGSIVV